MVALIVRVARLLSPDFPALARRLNLPIFITIPYSHYVELGRFSLQLTGKHDGNQRGDMYHRQVP